MDTDTGDAAGLTVRPLTPGDWPALARLFGPNGACGGCWCMWWRVPRGGKLWDESKGDKNRDAFRRLVRTGKVHGVLAFAGDEPVGWCCLGPRETFPRMQRVRALQHESPEGTWSVVCFYVPARWRGRGVAARLLEAATARAFALGARAVEGYPVEPKAPPAPVPAAFAWTGVPALFEKSGYRAAPRTEPARPVYRRELPVTSRTPP
jgi:GNAT superfamily N-acetyltransferase